MTYFGFEVDQVEAVNLLHEKKSELSYKLQSEENNNHSEESKETCPSSKRC